ncbi:MAG: hypothetical protein JSR66_17210 [Proteobacteria bacterium]|nr:hypothetical protein [Pseudomonadota bacterium]
MKELMFLWFAMAAPPAAWLGAFSVLLVLVNHGCEHEPVALLLTVGIVGAVIALGASIAAYVRMRRVAGDADVLRAERVRFMLQMAAGLGLMFLLLIGVTTVPAFWLSACPT